MDRKLVERSTGRSRGFGYVTFASANDAKGFQRFSFLSSSASIFSMDRKLVCVLSGEHILGERLLEVKIATPKEEMKSPVKKVTRIFVARIPLSVDESTFQRHFEEYGEITDLYMPKIIVKYELHRIVSKAHRGFGFITFASAGSVENLMADTHELGGATVEDDFKPINRMSQGGYGAYNAYISAATRYAAVGAPTLYDHPGPVYGRGESSRGMGKKIFVGRLPQEANVDDLRHYFGRFGRILDVYVPKDPKRSGHRGFGFVTFAEDGVADRISHRSHEICGQQVAIDSATPVDDVGPSFMMNTVGPFRGFGGPMRSYGRMYGGLHFDDKWSYAMGGARPSRADWRYRPY
ncbi:hypothetical protein GOBAR_AA10594 [Gossypium barbadense]|uniref:RRM domain-containing protein n=1 Tax=Gossypium barbadense TaxID=3634 RepID=A0A2P5Y373_GOSBA|nr:hypothetical protein GOBAR_AA10594 [Gossypium barbadense]